MQSGRYVFRQRLSRKNFFESSFIFHIYEGGKEFFAQNFLKELRKQDDGLKNIK